MNQLGGVAFQPAGKAVLLSFCTEKHSKSLPDVKEKQTVWPRSAWVSALFQDLHISGTEEETHK